MLFRSTFVGHPLLEQDNKTKTDLSSLIDKEKKIISIFAGSRNSETNVLLPILSEFIKQMNNKSNNYAFIFHGTNENRNLINDFIKNDKIENSQVVSDEIIKSQVLNNSIFAVAKSGTVSLEICNANVPSIIIYKINMINYFLMKSLVKVRFANIINIINNKEIIPELLQKECNPKEIFNSVNYLLNHPDLMKSQLESIKKTLNDIKSDTSSTEKTAKILSDYF